MDSLRILVLAVLALIATPSFAQGTALNVTSGSMVATDQDFSGVPYAFAGSGFSASGMFATDGFTTLGPANPLLPGPAFLSLQAGTGTADLIMSLTVHGVLLVLPIGAPAGAGFSTDFVLTGPGTYTSPFTFTGSFLGAPQSVLSSNPTAGCDVIACTQFSFTGGGIVKIDVVPDPNAQGFFDISQASFTFKAPEPPTMALLLLGFAGLAAVGYGRKRWTSSFSAASSRTSRSASVAGWRSVAFQPASRTGAGLAPPDLTLDWLDRLRGIVRGKLLVKGVVTGQDAQSAVGPSGRCGHRLE